MPAVRAANNYFQISFEGHVIALGNNLENELNAEPYRLFVTLIYVK